MKKQPPRRPTDAGQEADALQGINDPLIDPPFPAPYLDGIKPLPDALLAAIWADDEPPRRVQARADLLLAGLFYGKEAKVIVARHAWEQANGVKILVEPGWEP